MNPVQDADQWPNDSGTNLLVSLVIPRLDLTPGNECTNEVDSEYNNPNDHITLYYLREYPL